MVSKCCLAYLIDISGNLDNFHTNLFFSKTKLGIKICIKINLNANFHENLSTLTFQNVLPPVTNLCTYNNERGGCNNLCKLCGRNGAEKQLAPSPPLKESHGLAAVIVVSRQLSPPLSVRPPRWTVGRLSSDKRIKWR